MGPKMDSVRFDCFGTTPRPLGYSIITLRPISLADGRQIQMRNAAPDDLDRPRLFSKDSLVMLVVFLETTAEKCV
jgi:hypothetical protein